MAGRPFFMVTLSPSRISLFDLHLTQYGSMRPSSFWYSETTKSRRNQGFSCKCVLEVSFALGSAASRTCLQTRTPWAHFVRMSDAVARLNAALQGRYSIERELGEGGMATVYLANDIKHERKVRGIRMNRCLGSG